MRHVFVSYSHEDNDFAQLLRTELQKADIQTWLAQENLKAGEDWREGIDDAIKQAYAVIVVLSPTSDQSKYVTYEWALGFGMGIPIIPILYRPLKQPQSMHQRLQSLQYEDFSHKINRPWEKLINRLQEVHKKALDRENLDPKINDAIESLKGFDPVKIQHAAKFLGRRKIQSAVPTLLDVLKDESDRAVQNAVIQALGDIGDSSATETLIDFINNPQTRLQIIAALGKIGDAQATQALFELAKGTDCDSKVGSVIALENISTRNVTEFLFELLTNLQPCQYEWVDGVPFSEPNEVVEQIFKVLTKKVTYDDYDRLLVLLGSSDSIVVAESIKLLLSWKDRRALKPLLELTYSDVDGIQEIALSALCKLDLEFEENLKKLSNKEDLNYSPSIDYFYENYGLKGLYFALADSESKAYWRIAEKIEAVITEKEYSFLEEALAHSLPRVRGLTAEIIGRKLATTLCDRLENLINDNSAFVRGLAIRAIGRLGYRAAKDQVASRFEDFDTVYSNGAVRVADYAAIAYLHLEHVATPELIEVLDIHQLEILGELISISKSKVSSLSALVPKIAILLDLDDKEVVSAATRLLAEIGNTHVVEKLIPHLLNEDRYVKRAAILAISKLANSEFIPQLFATLYQCENLGLPGDHIVHLIQQFGSPTDAHKLLEFFRNSRHTYWTVGSGSINAIADQTITQKTLELLSIDNVELELLCLDILKHHLDESIAKPLKAILKQKTSVETITRIVDILAEFRDPSLLPEILPFADSKSEQVRCSVVFTYGKLKCPDSLTLIAPFITDSSYKVRTATVHALINLGESSGTQLIIDNLEIQNKLYETKYELDTYNEACIDAIGKLGGEMHLELLQQISIESENATYRAAAIKAIGQIGNGSSVEFLISKLSDKEDAYYWHPVCDFAAKALQRIGSERANSAVQEWLFTFPDSEKPDLSEDFENGIPF